MVIQRAYVFLQLQVHLENSIKANKIRFQNK